MDFLGIGIGLPQLLLVLVVAMLVLGPDRLPEVARQIAKVVRTLRGYASDVQSQFQGEVGDIREELLGIQRDLTVVQGSLRSGLLDIDQSLRAVHSEVQGAAAAPLLASPPVEATEAATQPSTPVEYKPAPLPGYRPSYPTYNGSGSGTASSSVGDETDPRVPDYRPKA